MVQEHKQINLGQTETLTGYGNDGGTGPNTVGGGVSIFTLVVAVVVPVLLVIQEIDPEPAPTRGDGGAGRANVYRIWIQQIHNQVGTPGPSGTGGWINWTFWRIHLHGSNGGAIGGPGAGGGNGGAQATTGWHGTYSTGGGGGGGTNSPGPGTGTGGWWFRYCSSSLSNSKNNSTCKSNWWCY